MSWTPTAEQDAIVQAARNTTDNLIIHALAGAAKTSTLVLIAKALPSVLTLCVAFNVRIKEELANRLPPNCECLTLNSVGHRAWGAALGRKLIVNKDKVYQLTRKVIEELPADDRPHAFTNFTDIMQAVQRGKVQGYVPDGRYTSMCKPLCGDHDFFANLPEEPSPLMEDIIKEVTFRSLAAAWKGDIDYDDQILMPTVFHGSFPKYPLVLVDETQDLNPLQHVMISKLVKERLMAVGDEFQSIYAFRGADSGSMAKLAKRFNMQRLELTVTFRCPQSVVREAHFRTPHMQWADWAEEGEVRHWQQWSATDLPNECVILCRNNAPLFSTAIRLIRNGRWPELVGNDIGKKLIKLMQKLGDVDMTQEQAFDALGAWRAAKLAKSREPGMVEDQYECMAVFLEAGKTLGEAIAYANKLSAMSGNIKMMTIHKSKGLEWPHVFLLDRHIIRTDFTQEQNLLYVAQTRAKRSLNYVTSEGFQGI